VTALAVARRAPTSGMFWIFVVLVGLVAAFSIVLPSGTFVTTFNAQTIAGDASTLLVLAAGATLVIVSGGLDLSIGSVMTFSAVVGALLMKEVAGDGGGHALAAAVAGTGLCLASGVAWGAVNGWLIAFVRLPPFVVTLGSLGAALGAARLLSGGSNVSGTPPELQEQVGLATVLGIPVPFIVGVGLVLVCGFLLSRTRWGERTYLIGSNEAAASRGGIPVARHTLSLYVLSGFLAACAGALELSRFGVASVSTGHTTELIAALAAVVIGGASLTGGVGTISGSVVGVLIPVVLANGLLIGGVERFWQDVVVGIILVAAVWFDQWRSARDTRDL
jgi:ribose transport system permease protein